MTLKNFIGFAVPCALALGFGPMPFASAFAGVVVSIQNVQQTGAGSGTFEVVVTNDPAGPTVDVAGFSFKLLGPAGSSLMFTAATTATVANPYIFDGSGEATIDPDFKLSPTTFPSDYVSAADTEWTALSIPLLEGDQFGLGLVSFTANPLELAGGILVSFDSTTSLTAPNLDVIDIETQDTVIRLGTSAVPEPSSLALFATGLIFATTTVRRGRIRG